MKRPMRLRLLGKPWRVEWVETLTNDGDDCYGLTTFDEQKIEVLTSIGPLELEQETVLHELLHALFEAADIEEHTESTVTRLAKVMLAAIKDNPSLLQYLRARKR